MKKKLLVLSTLTLIFGFSIATLLSCSNNNEEVVEETKYKVTYDQSDLYVVSGLAEEYDFGDVVSFQISLVDETSYKIIEVKTNDTVLEASNEVYSFIMPRSDVKLTINLEEIVVETIFNSKAPGENKTYTELSEFTPTLFKKDTFKEESKISLGEGVNHYVYSFDLNNSRNVKANVIEVDLTKASIQTNYAKSGVSTVYSQLQDFENTHDQKVMAITNADFFATGYGVSVNAYALNNEIIKNSHNDNGIYDINESGCDVPASDPKLLGISGEEALISSLINEGTREEKIKAKVTNIVSYLDKDNNLVELKNNIGSNVVGFTSNIDYILVTKETKVELPQNALTYTISINEDIKVITSGEISAIATQKLDGNKTFKDFDNKFYLIVKEDKALNVENGSILGFSLTTSDDTFKYYNTLIGGRQALVEDGEIAKTVTLENTNGAQTSNIPRTAVGVAKENIVKLVCIESLRYNSANTVVNSDSYGVNLPELAEFMRYIGCFDAMNFDGGGSSMLITKDNNGMGEPAVKVRSSDYGTYNLNDGRSVYNTILITTKV
ncbi:MAG: phosphodiester glycosidase family protein [Candidatus Onthovivens sp.]|nr:phosphodiester glycosidase family protein [Candidatus Onthovivens sp.]